MKTKRNIATWLGVVLGTVMALALNATLATKETWAAADIKTRTTELAERVIVRFALV